MVVHGSSVSVDGRGVLITGAAGSGKSGLALGLMALGATLVSDDRVILAADAEGGPPRMTAPREIAGRIEARGIGLLAAETAAGVPLVLIVDLDRPSGDRLPPTRRRTVCGVEIPVVFAGDVPNLAPAVMQAARGYLLP